MTSRAEEGCQASHPSQEALLRFEVIFPPILEPMSCVFTRTPRLDPRHSCRYKATCGPEGGTAAVLNISPDCHIRSLSLLAFYNTNQVELIQDSCQELIMWNVQGSLPPQGQTGIPQEATGTQQGAAREQGKRLGLPFLEPETLPGSEGLGGVLSIQDL